MLKANLTIFSIVSVVAIIFIFAFKVNGKPQNDEFLQQSYEDYKQTFMSDDGRIIDYDRNSITTSEGQSYMMMKALLQQDRETFDLVYKWTKDNLQRRDKLFAWLWGKNPQGEYKILDENSASDADIDIAFSLIEGYKLWDNYYYLQEALAVIDSIWNKEVRQIGDYLVLMPGAKQASETKTEVNPSYFSPYAFRVFQEYDKLHDWSLVINSSYYYLEKTMAMTKTGLPPNWFLLEHGRILFESSPKSDFSYDAIRVFIRIYLDYLRTGDMRALVILEKAKFFISKWERNNFYTNYKIDGSLSDKTEFSGSLSVLVPVVAIYDKKLAQEVYDKKIAPVLDNQNYWLKKKDYYAKNLIWFSIYLYGE